MAGNESGSGGQSNSGSKGRKYARNKRKCERYAAEHRRTKNNPARTQRPDEQTPHHGHRREESLAKVAAGRKRGREAKRAAETEKAQQADLVAGATW